MAVSSLGTGPPRYQQFPPAHRRQSKTRNRIRSGQVARLSDLLVEGVGVWSWYGPYSPSQCEPQMGNKSGAPIVMEGTNEGG